MKFRRADSGRWEVEFADDEEGRRFQMELASMKQLMPSLVKLWLTEPQFLTSVDDCLELMRVGGQVVDFHVSDEAWLTGTAKMVLRRLRSAAAGRPLDHPTLVAAMRLLLFAPYDLVLKLEKRRREKEYLAKERDRHVKAVAKKARARAIRDADMCVARAQKVVRKAQDEYLQKHPEQFIYFLIASEAASSPDVRPSLVTEPSVAGPGVKQP